MWSRRLNFVGNESISVHRPNNCRIARKNLVLQVQDVGVRGHMAQPLEHCKRKIGRRDLMRETFAD